MYLSRKLAYPTGPEALPMVDDYWLIDKQRQGHKTGDSSVLVVLRIRPENPTWVVVFVLSFGGALHVGRDGGG
jgi:hypothetical protein